MFAVCRQTSAFSNKWTSIYLQVQHHVSPTRLIQHYFYSLRILMPRGIIASALWVIFVAVVYKLATTTTESKIYDPFTILGLAQVSRIDSPL